MPVYFPQVNAAGMITQRPYKSSFNYSTSVIELPCGQRQRWGWRAMGLSNFPTKPLGQWDLNYTAITDNEVAVLRDFFVSMRGRFGTFSFLDPNGNLVPHSEDFANASWSKDTISVGATTTDPFGGSRSRTLTGGSANSLMYCTILPEGGASGFVLNFSVWAKAANANQQLFLAFIDSGFGIISNTTVHVPQTWTRIEHSTKLATNSYIRILIGGAGTWTSGRVISLFGAQAVPMRGPGGYMRTPGADGLHAKCRFDTDSFSPRYIGPNQISLTLPIAEYF